MTARVALYLQGAHPIREGMEHARCAEARGFRPSGGPRAGWCAGHAGADGRPLASVPASASGSAPGEPDTAGAATDSRLAATFATLDEPRSRPDPPGPRRGGIQLALRGRDRPRPPVDARRHAGGRGSSAGPAPQRDRDRRRDVRPPRRRGGAARHVYRERRSQGASRSTSATGMQMVWTDGLGIAEWRRPQLPRLPRARGHGAPRVVVGETGPISPSLHHPCRCKSDRSARLPVNIVSAGRREAKCDI